MIWLLSYKNPMQPIDHGSAKPGAIRERVNHAIIKDTFWRVLRTPSNRRKVLDAIEEHWWPTEMTQFWWVNQGDTYAKERDGGFVWAPQKGRGEVSLFHWQNVEKVKKGDVVFHYAKGFLRAISVASSLGYESAKPEELSRESWGETGWRADLKYHELSSPIPVDNIAQGILNLKISYGPVNEAGRVNQGYMYKLSKEAVDIIVSNMNLDELPQDIRQMLEQLTKEGEPMVEDYSKLLENIRQWIASKGFFFEPWQVAAYVTALRTKPFVILAGVSGTGKSKLPALVAEATGGVPKLIPVRPDWTDSSDVLGYCDLAGKFRPGQLLEFVQEATSNRNKHYVCIIDEMNPSRVEHYFAEVLSRIEDRRQAVTGGFESGPLLTQKLCEEDSHWASHGLPPNLAIVGTVNMDESAHGFSRKVLDRAFTIELSDIDLSLIRPSELPEAPVTPWPVEKWYPRSIQITRAGILSESEEVEVDTILKILTEINGFLVHAQLQVGYRTRDEIVLFVLHAKDFKSSFVTPSGEPVDPLDLALHMKVLPRIVGGSSPVRRTVLQLLGWAWKGKAFQNDEDATPIIEDWDMNGRPGSIAGAQYPRTAARLCLMWDRLSSEGFTSYWL